MCSSVIVNGLKVETDEPSSNASQVIHPFLHKTGWAWSYQLSPAKKTKKLFATETTATHCVEAVVAYSTGESTELECVSEYLNIILSYGTLPFKTQTQWVAICMHNGRWLQHYI